MAEKKCTHCNSVAQIPYAAHESESNRYERIIRRQWVAIILLICMLFACFATFVWYESQYETISYQQDGNGQNNVNIGTQGGLYNESEGSLSQEEKW